MSLLPLLNASTTAMAGTQPKEFPTIAQLKAVMEDFRALERHRAEVRRSCPVRKYLTAQGFNPDKGGMMILPDCYKEAFGAYAPPYVRFSGFASTIILAHNPFHDAMLEGRP
jgi:hypothetical protein